jgi:hypothetical protein
MQFIEENLPVLEAMSEAKQISVYLPTEADTHKFIAEATKLKLRQKASLGIDKVDGANKAETSYGDTHPVLPS